MDDDIYSILTNEYGLTDEQIEELMELGVLFGEQQTMIPRQQEMASELREFPMPRGRRYGGLYEAANPLEFVGAGLHRIGGFMEERRARKRQEEILKSQAAKRAAYLRGMQNSPPAAGGGQVPSFTGVPASTRVPWNETPVLSMQGNRWIR